MTDPTVPTVQPLAENKKAGVLATLANVIAAVLAIPMAATIGEPAALAVSVVLTAILTGISAISASITASGKKSLGWGGIVAIIVGVLLDGDVLTLPFLASASDAIGFTLRIVGAVLTGMGYPIWRRAGRGAGIVLLLLGCGYTALGVA